MVFEKMVFKYIFVSVQNALNTIRLGSYLIEIIIDSIPFRTEAPDWIFLV